MATMKENITNALSWFYDKLKKNDLDPMQKEIDELNSDLVHKTGDTMTGTLNINATTPIKATSTATSGDTFIPITSWTGLDCYVGVGQGGTRSGIWNSNNSKWLTYIDDSGDIHLGSSTVGSASRPMYLNGGVPTACTSTTSNSWYIRDGWAWRSMYNVTYSSISAPSSYLPVATSWSMVLVYYNSCWYSGAICISTSGTLTSYYYSSYGSGSVAMPSSATITGTIVYRYA